MLDTTHAPLSGDELRATREALGLSQEALARRLGVRHSTLWRWEHGKVAIRYPAQIRALLSTLRKGTISE